MNNSKLLLLSKSGDVYCSDSGENWLLVLSTGVTISEEVVSDRHFALFNDYCYLCVDDSTLYKTQDGVNWETISLTRYYYGKSIRTVGNYLYKFNGNPDNYSASLSRSSDAITWTGCGTGIPKNNYVYDIGSLNNQYVYIPVPSRNIYYKSSLTSTSSSSTSGDAYNDGLISKVLYSNKSNSLIVGLKSTHYKWYYLDPTNVTKFIKVEINSEAINSSGYFYDEHKDRYIAQFSNCWCYINASNVSSECTILDNATFTDSDTVVSSLIYKSNNNAT